MPIRDPHGLPQRIQDARLSLSITSRFGPTLELPRSGVFFTTYMQGDSNYSCLYFVNNSQEVLHRITVENTHSTDLLTVYDGVAPGEAVILDAFDPILDSDFFSQMRIVLTHHDHTVKTFLIEPRTKGLPTPICFEWRDAQ